MSKQIGRTDKQSIHATPATSASAPPKVLKKRRTPPLAVTSAVPPIPQGVTIPATSAALTGIGNAAQPIVAGAQPAPPIATSSLPVVTAATPTATTPAASGTPTVADPAPTGGAPPVPATFVVDTKTSMRGVYPNGAELAAMPNAVNDLLRFTDFNTVLGQSVLPAPALATAITQGIAWRNERDASNAWAEYVRAEDAFAWRLAMKGIEEVRPLFLFAVTKNPALATTYPWLAQLLNVPTILAKQAALSRANSAKKAKKAAASAAAAKSADTTAATVASATTAQVPEAVAPVAVTPGKTITVNT